MIEDAPIGGKSPLDWTADAALKAALEAATTEGYRQAVIIMTKPGDPTVRFFTAGLTASERHRMLCIAAADAIAGDLGLLVQGEEG